MTEKTRADAIAEAISQSLTEPPQLSGPISVEGGLGGWIGQQVAKALAGLPDLILNPPEAPEAFSQEGGVFAHWLSQPADPEIRRQRAAARSGETPEERAWREFMQRPGRVTEFRNRPWRGDEPQPFMEHQIGSEALRPRTERWGPERVGALQYRLVQVGALTGNFNYGQWDDASMQAYAGFLQFTADAGLTIEDAFVEWDQARDWAASRGLPWDYAPSGEAARQAFVPPTFTPKDPEEIKQDTRNLFRQLVGREPTPSELARFASLITSGERTAFDAAVEAQRLDFEAQQAAPGSGGQMTTAEQLLQSGGPSGVGPDPRVSPEGARAARERRGASQPPQTAAGGGTVQQFNPIAQAIAAIERERGAEIAVNQQVEESRDVRRLVGATGQRVSQLTGGR